MTQPQVRLTVSSHIPGMSDDNGTYPYTLAVLPCEKPAGHFQWVIRKHGKLVERVERSDRAHPPNGPPENEARLRLSARLKSAMIVNHASTRTTQLYDRRSDEVSLDEVERILI